MKDGKRVDRGDGALDMRDEECVRFGLTKDELRARLKHIAGLCYGLSCDISNVEIEADILREENVYLLDRLKQAGVNIYREGEDPNVRRLASLRYWEKKRREAGLAIEDAGEPRKKRKCRPQSAESRKKQSESLKKTWAKRKSEKAKSGEESAAGGDDRAAALRRTSPPVGEVATSPRPVGIDQRGEAE